MGEDSHAQVSFVQITDKRNKRDVWEVSTSQFKGAHFATYSKDLVKPMVFAGCPKNGVVLDPFFGSGTTGVVAIETGRHFVGIELNPEYVKIAQDRIKGTGYQASLYDMLEV
jgi:DNA modification methylase